MDESVPGPSKGRPPKKHRHRFEKGNKCRNINYLGLGGDDASSSIPSVDSQSSPSLEEDSSGVKTRAVEKEEMSQLQAIEEMKVENERLKERFLAKVDHLEELFELGWTLKSTHDTNCPNKLKMKKTEQRIISTAWRFACDGCNASTASVKMYEEIHVEAENGEVDQPGSKKPGRKSSTLNSELCGTLLQLSIQGTQCAQLFLNLGVNTGGSLESINRKCVDIGPTIDDMGENCLHETRLRAAERAQREGKPGVKAMGDTMYSTPIRYQEHTPMSISNQKVSVIMDKHTGEYLDLITEQNLCIEAGRALARGERPKCPDPENKTHKCSATLAKSDDIGDEGKTLRKHAEKLKADNVNVIEIITDNDSVTNATVRDVFPDAKHTYDNQHISRNLTKGLKKEPVRPVVFPPPPPNPNEIEDENNQRKKIAPAGIPETEKNQSSDKKKRPETPVQRRDRKMKAFAIDITQRINQEINLHHRELSKGGTVHVEPQDLHKSMNADLTLICIKCVAGIECGRNCKSFSKVCPGRLKRGDSKYLCGHEVIQLNEKELTDIAKKILEKKMSLEALLKSNPDTSTQKVEANNRSLIKAIPKCMTFIRTYHTRAMGHVLKINMGATEAQTAIQKKFGHNITQVCTDKLKTIELKSQKRKKWAQLPKNKKKRTEKRKVIFGIHEEIKSRPAKYRKAIEF